MVTKDVLIAFFNEYAYEPVLVYTFILVMLTASSFGLPIPEEVTLLSAGTVGYFAQNPDLYPPPYEGAKPINPWILAAVCFWAVFLSDLLIYWIGRWGRSHIQKTPRFQKILEMNAFKKAEQLIQRYGPLMAGVFRFTPGLRFPGHMACGMLGLPSWKFGLIDGLAALLTVPTQVLLVVYYGDEILGWIKRFKIAFVIVLVVILGIYVFRSMYRSRSGQSAGAKS
ncbi:MAG: DedA family protein [Calothrix sp. SM1_5_4]|nr:DedA family protein [Calothrix sp. SM1_5_4]